MDEREGRLARRMAMGIRVFLQSLEGAREAERTRTENVGPQGVRVLTERPWRTRERLLMIVPRTGWRLRAQVIYCLPREDGKYDIGVAWRSPPVNWAEVPPEALAS